MSRHRSERRRMARWISTPMGEADKWLVIGLGNPGEAYEGGRHNIGFAVVDLLAQAGQLPWKSVARLRGELALGRLWSRSLVLLKPQTYMNLSGESASLVAGYYRIPVERVIAVHDDIDLELGRLKLKRGGGDGGHKGIRSLSQHLGGPDFLRIRLGVGRPQRSEVTSFVLGGFRGDERDQVDTSIAHALEAVRLLITGDLREAMNQINRRPMQDKREDR